MGTSFLPSLRENVRVRTNTVVNLTLNTLYEVMQWLPAEPRAANARRMTGSGRCARLPIVHCCAGLRTGRWWWCPIGPVRGPS